MAVFIRIAFKSIPLPDCYQIVNETEYSISFLEIHTD